MYELLTFLAVAIVLPLGTLALFGFFTPRGERTPKKTTDVQIDEPPLQDIDARWEEFGQWHARAQQREDLLAQAPTPAPREQFLNVPLVMVVALLSPVGLVYLLTNFPMPTAAALVLVAFVATIIE